MRSDKDDLLDLLDYAYERLRRRLQRLTDEEWAWRPSPIDPDISIRWRLQHIVSMLRESRNWTWLGLAAPPTTGTPPEGAEEAAVALEASYAAVRSAVADSRVDLDDSIGSVAGAYGDASRRSFVLHIADELVHHGAETALLRDLYAAQGSVQ